jgi:hypothetical protein
VCRAYNRRLADCCSPYPDRLFGITMPPIQDVDLPVAEMRLYDWGWSRPQPWNNLSHAELKNLVVTLFKQVAELRRMVATQADAAAAWKRRPSRTSFAVKDAASVAARSRS